MLSRIVFVIAAGLFVSSSALANDWANSMFAERNHDFGSVARGAKTEYVFEFTNPHNEPVHVQSVRASCGCTTPVIVTETVAPGETGQIRAEFNTRSFLGQRGATVTVVFDRPRYAEAQLRVDGYVRRDVVCTPGEVNFGSLPSGSVQEKRIEVNYAGRNDWKIEGVNSTVPGLSVEVEETARANGRVSYVLVATLETEATGFITGEIELQTNDANYRTVPLNVSGQVAAGIEVSPSPLMLGEINSGSSVTKKVIVRGASEFRILSATCEDPRVSVEIPDDAKELKMLPISFAATDETGPAEFVVVIETDQPELGTIKVQGRADVVSN